MAELDVMLFPATDWETTSTRANVAWILEDWASVVPSGDDSLIVRHQQDALMLRWVLRGLDAEAYQVLKTLGERRSVGSVVRAAETAGTGPGERLVRELNRLLSGRILRLSVGSPGSDARLTVRPASRTARMSLPLRMPRRLVRLSRYVTVGRASDALEVRSPIRGFVLQSHGLPIGNLLDKTAHRACDPEELVDGLRSVSREDAVSLLAVMTATGVLGEVDDRGLLAEDQDEILIQRQPADVAFHHASRLGLHVGPSGATFRFAGSLPPTPALRDGTAQAQELVKLDGPGSWLEAGEVSFTEVVARRKSVRDHGSEPLTARQLGEFLFRVARVGRVIPVEDGNPRSYECSERPYPSGGGAYEIELYLVTSRCGGLRRGLYRYRPLEHALEPVAASAAQCNMLLENARMATGAKESPQVLILMGARFARLSWKYENMAYATTLKNVGVLYESMYLTAAAMGLACCAVGNSDSGLFAQATGLRVEEESSVGELTLGSLPDRDREGGEG
ncbi:SagB family peptide dehydrogenase [Plantactinospora sp. B24E8]|uniref:SagB/ThcOx family dehydrogenase n=1 Tax=Plantactinospora sp. B24E8 TaxID=3153567 RepID=UPI00325E6E34